MATLELTNENLRSTIDGTELVLIDFWASWCGPCQSFGPVFEKASEQHPDIVFAKVNTEEQMELAAQFQVRSIPMLAIFKQQILVYAQPGALPASALEQLIQQAKELDMDKVRAEIAQQQNTQA
jgi:thioredoxin 1